MSSNFGESLDIGSLTSECIADRIYEISGCCDLENVLVEGIPVQEYISQLVWDTSKPNQESLQSLFI